MAILDTLITRLGFQVDSKGLDAASSRVEAFKNKMSNAGTKVAATGTLLTGVLVGLSKTLKDFDAAMNETQAALGDKGTAGAMKELREQAKQMGATTQFSAAQAAQAQSELAKAGYDVAKITSTLPGVLSLAAAGTLDMGEAAGITTSVLAGFGLQSEQAGHVSDVLAKGAASGRTTVAELGFALSKAAPAAKAMGVSIEETVAQIIALQDAGLSAEVAGTGLKSVMLILAKPTKEAEKAMTAMGVSTAQVAKMAKQGKITEIFKLLGKHNLDAAGAATIFGREMATQALTLVDATSKVNGLTEGLIKADGAAEQMATTKMQGLPGAIALLTSKIEGAIIALGDAGLTQVIIALADDIGALVDKFTGAPPILQKLVIAALALGPALIAVGMGMKVVAGGIALVETIKAASGAMAIFNAVMAANPVGLLIVAVGALIAALVAVIAYWDDIVAAFSSSYEFVAGKIKAVGEFFGIGGEGGLEAAPAAATVGGAQNSTTINNNANYTVGKMNVDARGGDSKEIAQNVGSRMRDQFQNTAQDFDSGVAY